MYGSRAERMLKGRYSLLLFLVTVAKLLFSTFTNEVWQTLVDNLEVTELLEQQDLDPPHIPLHDLNMAMETNFQTGIFYIFIFILLFLFVIIGIIRSIVSCV